MDSTLRLGSEGTWFTLRTGIKRPWSACGVFCSSLADRFRGYFPWCTTSVLIFWRIWPLELGPDALELFDTLLQETLLVIGGQDCFLLLQRAEVVKCVSYDL